METTATMVRAIIRTINPIANMKVIGKAAIITKATEAMDSTNNIKVKINNSKVNSIKVKVNNSKVSSIKVMKDKDMIVID
jgi:cell division protein FtsX